SRDRMDFNLARIPATFTMKLRRPFDQRYMQALYNVGYRLGRKGYPWARFPPGYQELGAGPTLSAAPGTIGSSGGSQSF
ncbi:MAG: hypothetical protein ACREF0_11735, partial [Acetobacteraceae bacterium]